MKATLIPFAAFFLVAWHWPLGAILAATLAATSLAAVVVAGLMRGRRVS